MAGNPPSLRAHLCDHLRENSFTKLFPFLATRSRISEKHNDIKTISALLCFENGKSFDSYLCKLALFNPLLSHKTMKLYISDSSASYFGAANKCVSFVHPRLPELIYSCVLEKQLKIEVSTWCRWKHEGLCTLTRWIKLVCKQNNYIYVKYLKMKVLCPS